MIVRKKHVLSVNFKLISQILLTNKIILVMLGKNNQTRMINKLSKRLLINYIKVVAVAKMSDDNGVMGILYLTF